MAHSAHLDWGAICRRAGGRRKYNRVRQIRAELRFLKVVELLRETGFSRGYQTWIAKELGVSCATICCDIAKLLRRCAGGKEVEERHRLQEKMQRRIRAEDRLERDRIAGDKAALGGDGAPPASPKLDVRPPTTDSAHAMFVPRWLSCPRSALADIFRPLRSREGWSVRGCRQLWA